MLRNLLSALFPAKPSPPLPAADQHPQLVVSTSHGDFTLELDGVNAPIAVANFLAYTAANFYDGTIFHRVMRGFMIQGGSMTPDFTKKRPLFRAIRNEADNGLKNVRGTIAMARTWRVHSAQNQFYINLVDNTSLDFAPGNPGYAVFGRVIEGMDLVREISLNPVSKQNGMEYVPITPVSIKNIKRIK